MGAGVYQEPPLDPEHLVTSAATLAEAQRRSQQLADSVLIKALKVIPCSFSWCISSLLYDKIQSAALALHSLHASKDGGTSAATEAEQHQSFLLPTCVISVFYFLLAFSKYTLTRPAP